MTYVMSDIHGNSDRFNSIMKQINLQPEDTLYILGDVIDRGPDGIRILKKIMGMPNVKMLLGNHEYLMLHAIGHCRDVAEEKQKANLHMKKIWYGNGGEITHNYLKHIRKEDRAKIFEFVRNLPINIDVEVNGIKYKLVHASPVENFDAWYAREYRDVSEFAVWERWNETCPVPEGCVMIFGHTPTCYFQEVNPWRIWIGRAIGIDCGAGYKQGRLACLRLDDMQEFYSE